MENDVTDISANTSEGEGKNTADIEGAGTQPATTEGRVFTQDAVNKIVQDRLAEAERKQKQKLADVKTQWEKEAEERLEGILANNRKEWEASVQQRIDMALNAKAMETTKTQLVSEYGLTEAQTARLTGATPDELKADAETLFGGLKQRKPPVIHTGDTPDSETVLDISKMTPAEIREKGSALWSQMKKR